MHVKEVVTLNTLGDFFLFLTKVLITLLTALLCYVFCKFVSKNNQMVFTPVLLTVAISYIIAFYVVEIFELTIDVIFMSYLYESEFMLGERQSGQPSFAPKSLAKLLKKPEDPDVVCCGKHKSNEDSNDTSVVASVKAAISQ